MSRGALVAGSFAVAAAAVIGGCAGVDDWQRAPGAIIVAGDESHEIESELGMMFTVHAHRRSDDGHLEKMTALHALITIPSPGNAASSGFHTEGPVSRHAMKWYFAADARGEREAAELEILFDGVDEMVTIGYEMFDIERGNLFLINLTPRGRTHVTQLEGEYYGTEGIEAAVRHVRAALPDDSPLKPFRLKPITRYTSPAQ